MTDSTSFRLSEIARKLLAKIAKESGISLTAALEIAIREAAKKRGITREKLRALAAMKQEGE